MDSTDGRAAYNIKLKLSQNNNGSPNNFNNGQTEDYDNSHGGSSASAIRE